ncbi:MAG: hypothetical protein ACK4S4_15720 [Pyrinomonadaceae bacterium]
MNNQQMVNQIVRTFDSIKADKNGNVHLLGRLSFNKQGGLSTRLYVQSALGFIREYRRNLLHNGSSVSFETLCETLAERADIEQILAYRYVKTGEDKAGDAIYSKVTFNKAERAERIRSLSKRIKSTFQPAFGWNSAEISGVNLSASDLAIVIKSAARMVNRVANPYVKPEVSTIVKKDGRKVKVAAKLEKTATATA